MFIGNITIIVIDGKNFKSFSRNPLRCDKLILRCFDKQMPKNNGLLENELEDVLC